jgi:hypothetical protein
MGFSQVVNHGTPREVIDEMFTQSRAFFTQPVAQRHEVLRTQANPWGFYDRGLTKNRRDLKEIYDFGPPDGATIRPQWPQRLPRFRNAVHKPTTGKAKGWCTACWPRSRQTRACRRAFSAVISDTRPARYREINWGEFRARRADGDYADQGEEIQIEHNKFSA